MCAKSPNIGSWRERLRLTMYNTTLKLLVCVLISSNHVLRHSSASALIGMEKVLGQEAVCISLLPDRG